MVCARCGHSSSSDVGRCTRCGAPFTENLVATGVIPIDTTGLPPGATFEPTIARPKGTPVDALTLGEAATIGPAPPIDDAMIGRAATMGAGATMGNAATMSDAATIGGTDSAAQRESGPLKVGQAFGPRYHILTLLGAGGMGAVYQAWDAELGVAVALKVIRTSKRRVSAELEKRFKNELLLARSVTHKNVVRIHDLGEIEDTKYITMSYVQGHDLSTLLRRESKFPIARALSLSRQIAAGLEAAHDAGVVHRDLKPANIMIGADDLALIMDFGISASAEQATTGGVVGTLEYMAPEQGTGQAVDGRADIYAFGLILYELLTGPRLVASVTPRERIEAMKYRTTAGLPPIRSIDASIPEPLATVVSRCLERDPAARYQTTTELAAALNRLDDAGEWIPEARHLTPRLLAAAATIVVVLIGGTYFVGRRTAPVAPPAHEPVSILIADFDNRTNDPVFQGSLEQTLGIAIEGASFVTAFPRRDALRIANQIKPQSHLDESVAQLVSLREGINVVLAGTIEPQGSGYKLAVRALDPAAKKTLVTDRASASSKDDVLRTLGTLAARVRRVLGDATPERAKLAYAETFTASSLQAVQDYSAGQDLLGSGKFEDAIAAYKRAIQQDPKFGRAYSGWATGAFYLGRQDEAAEQWKQALALMDRMTEREKYLTFGTYYLAIARNYEKAAENYSTLVKLYPADRVGHNNLAFAYFSLRNFSGAVAEGRRALEIAKKNTVVWNNYALYAMYAGDFAIAESESRKLIEQDRTFFKAYLPLAISALTRSDAEGARKAYERMAGAGTSGASLANMGLADLALYEGRFTDAEAILKAGIAEDGKQRDTAGLAAKYVALAEAYDGEGRPSLALATVRQALGQHHDETVAVPSALTFLRAGRLTEAKKILDDLGQQLQPQTRAYAKTLEAEIARREHRTADAVEAFKAAQKLSDLWLTRFDLGVTYVEAGHEAEGLAELELCQKRRGEATALFLDDVPTFRSLATLPYWLARAQEGVGQTQTAADNYRQFLALRGHAAGDPLVADTTKRIVRP